MYKPHYYTTLILWLFFSGCSSLYMPNVPDTPMLTEKGELHASGHFSLRGNVSLNTAYAVSDNFAVLVNGAFINRDQQTKDYRQSLFETGAGYFDTFGADNSRIFEIYAGFGKGKSEKILNEINTTGQLSYDRREMKFSKTFIQINYSSKKQRSLHLFGRSLPLNYGTSIRGSHVIMRDFKRNDLDQTREDNIFIEPIFFTRMYLSDAVQLQYTTGSNFGLKNRKYLKGGDLKPSFW